MPADPERVLRILQSEEMVDRLASIEHERWSDWQRYLHSKCVEGEDGTLAIPAELVRRWSIQMETKYEDLSDEERQSDRDQVYRYLPIIVEAFREK